jgi:tetratricopeptide (TPR) repeat protein
MRGAEATLDHAAAIDANLDRLIQRQANPELLVPTMLDMINYYTKRTWWNREAVATWRENVESIALRMQELAPEHRLTLRAKVDLARARELEDPEGALALLEEVIEEATKRNEESIVLDTLFNKGMILGRIRRPVAARTAYGQILRHESLDPLFEGEVYIHIGNTYVKQRRYDWASWSFARTTRNERYPACVRATAQFLLADSLNRLGSREWALEEFHEIVRQYPDELAAVAAQRRIDFMNAHSK